MNTCLFSSATQVTPDVFWKILRMWITSPLYKRIDRMEVIEKIVNGEVMEHKFPIDADYNNNTNLIEYIRQIFPKDHNKKPMCDTVRHYVSQNRVEYTHQIENKHDLPKFCIMAKNFSIQLQPITEEEKKEFKIMNHGEMSVEKQIENFKKRGKINSEKKKPPYPDPKSIENDGKINSEKKKPPYPDPKSTENDGKINSEKKKPSNPDPKSIENDGKIEKTDDRTSDTTSEPVEVTESVDVSKEVKLENEEILPILEITDGQPPPSESLEPSPQTPSKKRKRSRGRARNTKKRKNKIEEDNLLRQSIVIDRDGSEFSYKMEFRAVLFEEGDLEFMGQLARFYFREINKWAKNERNGGYQKRVLHDRVVDREAFGDHYRRLKEKYSFWVEKWEESTDPKKFIFEDIGIAAFLISLWEDESKRHQLKKNQTFVDLGCGNGFLVYLLTMEGYEGWGIDLKKRKVWDKYPPEVKLKEGAIQPLTDVYAEDWLIANHADELTPWTPFIASRQCHRENENGPQLGQRYFVLPCCEWDFDKKFSKKRSGLSRFFTYLDYVQEIGTKSGFQVLTENLRIPSTRNIAQIGFYGDFCPKDDQTQIIVMEQQKLLKAAGFMEFVPKFRSDHRGGPKRKKSNETEHKNKTRDDDAAGCQNLSNKSEDQCSK